MLAPLAGMSANRLGLASVRKYSINRSESARVMIGPARVHRPTNAKLCPHLLGILDPRIAPMAARCPRCQRPTTRTSILPFLGILGSCLGPVASGEPGEAPLPVRLRAGSRPSGSALPPRCSAVHPWPPESSWPLASAPVEAGRVPHDVGCCPSARDPDHDPAAQGGNPLSPGSQDPRRTPPSPVRAW